MEKLRAILAKFKPFIFHFLKENQQTRQQGETRGGAALACVPKLRQHCEDSRRVREHDRQRQVLYHHSRTVSIFISNQ